MCHSTANQSALFQHSIAMLKYVYDIISGLENSNYLFKIVLA